MKLLKSVDEKFRDIGFEKKWDNDNGVVYIREDKAYGHTQCLSIARNFNGKSIVLSYECYRQDDAYLGSTCVGLTYYEMKLVLKKMRQKRWRSR